jgi:hypothetical protein
MNPANNNNNNPKKDMDFNNFFGPAKPVNNQTNSPITAFGNT